MSVSFSMQVAVTLSMVGVLFVIGCGGGDDEAVEPTNVYRQEDSKTLKEEGTALTEEDKQRREERKKERVAEIEAGRKARRLMARIKGATDEIERADYIATVADLGDDVEGYAKFLEPYLTDESSFVRRATIEAWGALKGEAGKAEILKAFADDDDTVVATAVKTWRKARLPKSVEHYRLLEHFDPKVQYEALELVTEGRVTQADLDAVIAALENMDGPTSRQALEVLVAHKGLVVGLPTKLIPLLDHTDATTRVEAVKAMGTLVARKVAVAEKLVELLGDDPDTRVCSQAHVLLKAWGAGNTPFYDPNADDEQRERAAAEWATWLAANRALFQG